MNKLEELKALIESIEPDYIKFYEKGVKAPSTRIRKCMQDVKQLAQEIRVSVQEHRNELDK